MDGSSVVLADRLTRSARNRAGGRHGPDQWVFVVRELEASFQAMMLVRDDPAAGTRLMWLRLDGKSWSEVLALLRAAAEAEARFG